MTVEIVEGAEDEGVDDSDAEALSTSSTRSSDFNGINEGEDADGVVGAHLSKAVCPSGS